MVRRITRRQFNLGLAGLVGGLAVGCAQTGTPAPAVGQQAPAPSFPKEVKVGVIWPLTGPTASVGLELRAGVELAAEVINGRYDLDMPLAREEGLSNLGGAKVTAVWADHGGSPEKAQAEAERLITQEKVVALIGAYQSSATATSSQVAERLGIPYLAPYSSSPSLTERGFKWFFRTWPHDGIFGKHLFDVLKELEKIRGIKVRTLGIINENTLWGTDVNKITKQYAQEYGYQVVVEVTYPANTSDVTSEVQRVKAANPDVLIQASYTSDAILFMRTYKQLDYVPQAILAQNAGFVDPEYPKVLGRDGDYVITRAGWSPDSAEKKPIARKVAELYRSRTGRTMTDLVAAPFTGMLVLADAINRAKSLEPEAIRRALLETDIPGDQIIMPWRGVKFDEKTHQNIYAHGVNLQIIGGQY
ncbi:MAG: branched-chain amino acid ABC transporter substrate-binding protein, partial [Chloroflexota bacterium]